MRKYIIIILSLFAFNINYINAQQKTSKKSKLKFTFSERTRLTSFDNTISLDNTSDIWAFSRHKTNLGLQYTPNKNIELKFNLGNEARMWFSPRNKKSELSEIFIDQLYLKWRNIAKLPLEIKIVRQNIMLDEGFICLDGQPLTGSRSAYFNAVKGVYSFNKNNNISAFVSYIPKTDDLLPIINENSPAQLLEEQANTGIGLYYKTKVKNSKLSLYYFRKNTKANDKQPIEDKINALGSRIMLPLSNNLELTTEAAYEIGKSGKLNMNAFGGYSHLDYNISQKIPIVNTLTLGGFYLSGDDPTTGKVEGWNPLWSRWPKWSESYIYTLIIENKGKVAYWSNIASLYTTLKGNLSKKMSFKASYYHLMALQDNLSSFCSGTGKTRGELITLRLNYKIDKNWSGHLLWENFTPGNYYPSTADGYNFLRFELLFKI